MEFTDEQWQQFMRLVVKTDSVALMMDMEDAKYRHPKREQQMFDIALHKYDTKYKPHIMAARVGKRVAIALIAAILAAAMTIMTVSAAREWFISIIREVFPGSNAHVEAIPNSNAGEFIAYAPTYIPEGYELMEHTISDKHKLAVSRWTNLNDPSHTISIKQYSSDSLKYDHSGEEVGYVDVAGNEATYSRKGNRQMISWSDGVGLFLVTIKDDGIDKSEAIKICESLVPEITLPK